MKSSYSMKAECDDNKMQTIGYNILEEFRKLLSSLEERSIGAVVKTKSPRSGPYSRSKPSTPLEELINEKREKQLRLQLLQSLPNKTEDQYREILLLQQKIKKLEKDIMHQKGGYYEKYIQIKMKYLQLKHT